MENKITLEEAIASSLNCYEIDFDKIKTIEDIKTLLSGLNIIIQNPKVEIKYLLKEKK
jgi:hypothetical protein